MAQHVTVTHFGMNLLEHAPEELKDTVRAGACKELHAALMRVSAKPGTVRSYDVESAELIVAHLRSAEVLAKIARTDQRIAVKLALRRHPVKFDAVGKGRSPEVRKRTQELLARPHNEIVELMQHYSNIKLEWDDIITWLRNLPPAERGSMYQVFISRADWPAQGILLGDVHKGKVPGETLERILEEIKEKSPAWQNDRNLSRNRSFSQMLQIWGEEIDADLAKMIVESGIPIPENSTFSREAAKILSASPRGSHVGAAVKSNKLTEEEIVELFQKNTSPSIQSSILAAVNSKELVNKLAEQLGNTNALRNNYDLVELLNKWEGLSTKASINLLRSASSPEIVFWASGLWKTVPREGEGALFAETLLNPEEITTATAREVISKIDRTGNLNAGVLREMWEVFYLKTPRLAKNLLASSAKVVSVLVTETIKKIANEFGGNTNSWETFATLVNDWNGTIPELIDTVKMVANP